ncbi:MAG TPA: ABC transporter ATP-binding protein, partial [Arthrobacter bacterium]|nr:ABC transporter ATP-binding protein [Arthrobacter sp.]
MTEHLNLSGVSHGYGDRQLLDGIGLVITAGEHVAIVGENGAGKSTLLRILAGLEAPDEGTAVSHGRVGYLAQTHGLPESFTVGAAVDASLASLRGLEAELDRLEAGLADAEDDDLETYGRLQTEYQLREGYAAESRVEAALDRLGLGGLDRKRTLGSLSGGEQERVALACVLADPADILLLDEPTNHLDARGTAWLEDRLAAHRGTVVVVSHDRVLLRKVASTVIEVDAERRAVTRYGNGYDGYLREKAAERQRWVQQYHEWIDAMDAEQRQADTVAGKMGYARQRDNDKVGFDFKAGTWQKAASSKVRNAQERLRRLEASPIDRPPVPLRLAAELAVDPGAAASAAPAGYGVSGATAATGGDTLGSASAILTARGVAVPDRLGVTDFAARTGEKILITGPNGAGKSTLLSVLAGTLEPVEGLVQRPARIGYLQQELELPQRPTLRLLPAFAAGLGGNI